MKTLLLIPGFCLLLTVQSLQAQTSYTWAGTFSTSWNTATNWSPVGVPGSSDNVTIVTAPHTCKLGPSTIINNITLTSGTLDLNGGSLVVTGTTAQFSTGTVQNGTISITGATTTTFGNGPVTMNCVVDISSLAFLVKNTTFQSTTTIIKTGSTNDASDGGNTFNGALTVTNAGSGYLGLGNVSGDQFNGTSLFHNTGTSNIYVGNSGTPSVFNGVTTFTNSPTVNAAGIYVSWNATGTVFNNNIIVNSTAGAGVQFCGGTTAATAKLASGYTITVGAGGFSVGTLLLSQFTQVGATAQNIPLTAASSLQIGPSSTFNGNLTVSTPTLSISGSTFNGTTSLTKTGSTNDGAFGGNTFNSPVTFTENGSGYLALGSTAADLFNSSSTFNNQGSAAMYIANNSTGNIFNGTATFNNAPTSNQMIQVSQNSTGTTFNGNIVVTSTNGQGVQFCVSTGTATLSTGYAISVGGAGFSAGTLLLRQFTQVGGTPQSLTLSGTANLTLGNSSAFGGNMTTVSSGLQFNGATFSGTVNATKNGATNDASSGNDIFTGAFTMTNTGSGSFAMGVVSPDTWQSTAVFNNYSTVSDMYVAYGSSGNVFNGDVTFNDEPGDTSAWIVSNVFGTNTLFKGNIIVECINGGGVSFGTGTGNATLVSGTVSVGAAGFTGGGLIFQNFTQSAAAAAQTITVIDTAYIQFGPGSTFNAPVTSVSPGIAFNGCVFNNPVNATKTGTSFDLSLGGNTFNANAIFANTSTTGFQEMAFSSGDTYNGNVTFTESTGTGPIYPDYNANCLYNGNLTFTCPAGSPMLFGGGTGTGTATFSATTAQTITATAGTPAPIFGNVVINNSSGVTLVNAGMNIRNNLTMTAGLLNTTTSNMLTMLNGSTTASGNASSTSYVNGPMQYQKATAGPSTLNFPVGAGADCRPIALQVNHSNTTMYVYLLQVFNASAAAIGWTLPSTVTSVSSVHYWMLTRDDGGGVYQPNAGLATNATITLFFGPDDNVTDGTAITVCKNIFSSPGSWFDIGGTGGPAYSGGSALTGSITSTSSPTAFNSFSKFTIGWKNVVLPIGLLNFTATPDNSQVNLNWTTSTESNNSYFDVQRSQDGVTFDFVTRVQSMAPGGNSTTPLSYAAVDPNPYPGVSEYRLKQTDLNGDSTYSRVVRVDFNPKQNLIVYPSPSTGSLYISGIDLSMSSVTTEWYDLSGRLLTKALVPVRGGVASLNVSLRNGMYLLKMIFPDGTTSTKSILFLK